MKPLVKDTVNSGVPVFQNIIETIQGGFLLDESVLAAGTVVKAGTVIGYDETTRKAKVLKGAVVKNTSGTTDTTHEVYKGHNLAVGMLIKVSGGTAYAITNIDTSNGNFDVITTATALSTPAVTAGTQLFVDDDGYNMAKGLLLDDAQVSTGEDVAVLIKGTVYENRIAPVSAVIKALMPNIFFSKSY